MRSEEEVGSVIHFDFIVSDVDAENIFDCISSEINRCNVEIIDSMASRVDKSSDIEWLKSHVKYLTELKKKMSNTRVKE